MKPLYPLLLVLALSACSRRLEHEIPIVAAGPDAININTATEAELERLPHVGERTAAAILEFRSQNGPFRRVEQVMLIRGVSERRFLEIRPYIRAE